MQEFNYHTHTYRCGHADLDYTDEEYVKEYIKAGFKKIAFTDHCPEKIEIDKEPNVRMKYDQKEEYLESIKKLKEKYAGELEIESGFEIEYLPGEEENILELKRETDKIILGQHFIYADNKELKRFFQHDFTDKELLRYAEYMDKAMELGIPNIIAHPDLYMRKRKSFGEIEEKVANLICSSAEKYDVPLEINLNNIFHKTYYENKILNNLPIEKQKEKLSDIVYPCKEFWNVVAKYNIRVVYGIDVHNRGQITLWKELVELANEILGEDIISKLNFVEDV